MAATVSVPVREAGQNQLLFLVECRNWHCHITISQSDDIDSRALREANAVFTIDNLEVGLGQLLSNKQDEDFLLALYDNTDFTGQVEADLDMEVNFPKFVSIIQNVFPHMKTLGLCFFQVDNADEKMAMLIQHMPSQVGKVWLHSLYGDSPLTFQALGTAQQLRHIAIKDCGLPHRPGMCFWTPDSFQILADSLEKLPHLEIIEIEGWAFSDPKACLESLYCALGSKENVVDQVEIDGNGWYFFGDPNNPDHLETEGLYVRCELDMEYYDSILENGPSVALALKQGERKGLFSLPQDHSYNGDLVSWVEALIYSKDLKCKGQDRLDAFHLLVSKMPPHLLKQPKCQRILAKILLQVLDQIRAAESKKEKAMSSIHSAMATFEQEMKDLGSMFQDMELTILSALAETDNDDDSFYSVEEFEG